MARSQAYQLVSVEDYLAGELQSETKHEYLGGVVYAMAGGRNDHNLIATNTLASLHSRLQGQACRAYNSDTKVRIQLPTQTRFYYPDALVVCDSNPGSDTFQDFPTLIVEVLSSGTRRTDEGEKKEAYLTIPTLKVFLLMEQQATVITVFRRTETGFRRETVTGIESTVPLPELGIELPLAQVYDGVSFAAEPTSSDG